MNTKNKDSLLEKIRNREAVAAVIGLGYVGLPLAVEFAREGLEVIGIDLNKEKVDKINRGTSYIVDVKEEDVMFLTKENRLKATTDFSVLKKVDTINICVPTPLRKTKDPDISYIVNAAEEIVKYIHAGQLIILESTTYPGTTEEVLLPLFEEKGLVVGEDFFLAFSPERVDPGNAHFQTKNITKVVGGITPECSEVAKALYEVSLESVHCVSSPKVAEMVKLLENTFRSVNIGLVNEICLMSNKLGVDVWEVIDAAATKPFGFMPFYPGPGLGGHCIPIDPFYLSWKARLNGFDPRFIELAGEINSHMPEHVVTTAQNILNTQKKALNGATIVVLGISYKADIDDMRESPALEIITFLEDRGANVIAVDPYAPQFTIGDKVYETVAMSPEILQSSDLAIIITNHKVFDYNMIVQNAKLVLDTRNATKNVKEGREKIRKI
ncbi:nucleotide sugar dehydrogenase [Candidatus Omnitrophota bacterium]